MGKTPVAEGSELAASLANLKITVDEINRWLALLNKKLPPIPAAPPPVMPARQEAHPHEHEHDRGHAHDHDEKKRLKETMNARAAAAANLKGIADQLKQAGLREGELVAALDAFNELHEKQKLKNSSGNEKQLLGIIQQCEALKSDPKVGALVLQLETNARMELAKVQVVRKAVGSLCGGKKGWTTTDPFNKDGVFNESGSVQVKRPPEGVGLADTAGEQIEKYVALIEKEASRSNAFAELLLKVANSPAKIDMFICKNSCGFCDNPGQKTLDMGDFDCLLDDPIKDDPKSVAGGTNSKLVGLCKGEILMHVFEERLYMFQSGAENKPYIHAHNDCLKSGSFQNQYRKELGMDSETIDLDQVKVGTDELFVHRASDGVESQFPVNTAKSGAPEAHRDYKANPADVKRAQRAGNPFDPRIAACTEKMRKLWTAAPKLSETGQWDDKKFTLRLAESDMQSAQELLKHWLERKLADPAALEAEFKREMHELREWCKKLPGDNPQRIRQKSAAAKQHLQEEPRNDGSADLKLLRSEREKAGAINDAEMQKNRDNQTDHHTNCAVTTLGAISGKNSTSVMVDWLTAQGLGAKADSHKGTQDFEIWSQVERGMNGRDSDRSLMGDAQLRGIRKNLLEVVESRNGRKDLKQKYEVVQDGLNEEGPKGGKMYDLKELVRRMKSYPDGTQFQVFLKGAIDHWVYAEIYNGELVFEDYQTSSTKPPGKGQEAGVAKGGDQPGEMPEHPINGNPDTFEMGMFLAIAPKNCKKEPPYIDPAGNWPQPGTKEDKKITALVMDLRKNFTAEGFVTTVAKHKKALKGFACDVTKLPKIIEDLQHAEAECSPHQFPLARELESAQARIKEGTAQLAGLVTAITCQQVKALAKELVQQWAGDSVGKVGANKTELLADLPDTFLKQIENPKAAENFKQAHFAHKEFAAQVRECQGFNKKTPREWNDSHYGEALKIFEAIKKIVDDIDASAIPGLKAHLVKKVIPNLGLERKIKAFEKSKRLAAAVPDENEFMKRMAQDQEAFARQLGRDELSDDEIEKAAADRRSVQLDRDGLAIKTRKDISDADRQKETENLDKREAALSDDKLLEKKKAQFTESLKSITQAVKDIKAAIAALKLPPTPENDIKEADRAREKLTGAVAETNDTLLIKQLEKALVDPLTAEINSRRYVAPSIPGLDEFLKKFESFLAGKVGNDSPKALKDAFTRLKTLQNRGDVLAVKPIVAELIAEIGKVPKQMLKRQLNQQLEDLPAVLKG